MALRLIIWGTPGSSIFELGEKLSQFHRLDYYTIEKVPDEHDSYFDDHIPTVLFDTGDFSTGSASQHMVRNPQSLALDRELEIANPSVPDSDGYEDSLGDDERAIIGSIEQGIVVTDIPDLFLLDWATHVLFLYSDEKIVIDWFSKRLKCFTCQSVYHLEEKPPKVRGKCDRCGSPLGRQEQDEPALIKEQFKGWRNSFWKFEETAKKKEIFKILNIDDLRDFQDILSRANLWVINDIVHFDAWYECPVL
jgi:hypothetical protein